MKTYNFKEQFACNMCGTSTENSAVLGMRLNQSQGINPRNKTGIGVAICKSERCRLNFPQPLPISNRISDHYDVPPESYWKENYFGIDPEYFSSQIKDANDF